MNLSAAIHHRIDHLTQRQGVVASNIANASTPNYLAKDLQFAGYLQQTQAQPKVTHPRHQRSMAKPTAGRVTESDEHKKLNGNSVKLDVEMLKLNQIQLDYQFVTGLYRKHSQMQSTALGRNNR